MEVLSLLEELFKTLQTEIICFPAVRKKMGLKFSKPRGGEASHACGHSTSASAAAKPRMLVS